jgi:hypothetical protein
MEEYEYRITTETQAYWITKAECDRYLSERQKTGVTHVALRDGLLILPVKFEDIAHTSAIEISETMERMVSQRVGIDADDEKRGYAD